MGTVLSGLWAIWLGLAPVSWLPGVAPPTLYKIKIAMVVVLIAATWGRAALRREFSLPAGLAGLGGLLTGIVIVASVIAFKQIRKTEKGKAVTDQIILRLPIFGLLLRKVAVAKFTRTLGTLISSGVPILDGLEITAKTAGNKVIEYAVMDVRTAVSEGKTFAEPLMKSKVFPPMVTHMIAVGESTGALDTMMNKIADFYDDEVDNAVNNLTAMMEPMLMVFLGGSVGFIVIAMYLPIFKLITLIK